MKTKCSHVPQIKISLFSQCEKEFVKFLFTTILYLGLQSCNPPPSDPTIVDQQLSFRGLDSKTQYLTQNVEYYPGELPIVNGKFKMVLNLPGWVKSHFPERTSGDLNGDRGWTRMRIPELSIKDSGAVLIFQRIYELFEVYCEGQLVYRYGNLLTPEKKGYQPKPIHVIPLKEEYSNKVFFVRHWSNIGRIGFYKVPVVTTERRFLFELIKEEIPRLSVCMVAICLAIILLIIPTTSKEFLFVLPLFFFLTHLS